MKTRLPRQEFLDALTAAAAIAGGRTTRTILNCVHLTTSDDGLLVCATDGEAAIRLMVSAFANDRQGETVVSADRLLGIVREMPDAEILLEADERHCTVRGAGSEFKIFVQDAADFPPAPDFEGEPDLKLDGRQLWQMINLTIYAAARETSRYAINGVLWQKRGRRLYLVATDGRRLARSGGSIVEASSADFEAIVPAKALHVFERVFAPGKERDEWMVDVKLLPNQILLRAGNRVLVTVLVEGHFPKYEDVIPKDSTRTAHLDRSELHGAVRRAALLTSDDARAVRLSFSPGSLVITAQSPDQGEARIELPAEFEGEALEIGFNPNFVSDALKSITHETVQIDLQDSFRPGVLTATGRDDFLYVIMPVSL